MVLTLEQKEKFNRFYPNTEDRIIAMSIFASINYWQDKEIGVVPFSLDNLFKRYKNKFYLSLSNFKKKAEKLVYYGFLKVKRKGKLKFYGTTDCKSDKEIREENSRLKEENQTIREEFDKIKMELEELKKELNKEKSSVKGEEDKNREENKEILSYEYKEVPQKMVIETAYDRMKEIGIKDGSTIFRQVIESLYIHTDKKAIHNKGLYRYIDTVIEDKVNNQKNFIEKLKYKRKINSLKFNNFKGRRDYTKAEYAELEKKLLGWD